jgi:integrase
LCVDLSGRRPTIRIRAHAQKSGKDQKLRIAPEFAEFLLQTPEDDRTGYVFNPIPRRKQSRRFKLEWASAVISAIGREAGVKVAENDKGRVKFASAHDLRRAFGMRWSNRVKPLQLQRMMRHADFKTTLKYDMDDDDDAFEDAIWDGFTNEFTNSRPQTKNATPLPTSQSVATERV